MQNSDSIRKSAGKFKLTEKFTGRLCFDEPMRERTSFQIGGNAPLFLEPADERSLVFALEFLRAAEIPYFVLGGATNVVISDKGFDGAVISTRALNGIKKIEGEERAAFAEAVGIARPLYGTNAGNGGADTVFAQCGAGVSVADFVEFCTENCMSGMETFSGLPGTVGGALYMNARCFERSFSDVFVCADFLTMPEMRHDRLAFSPGDWDYKTSPFQNTNNIILSAVFALTQLLPEEKSAVAARCAHYIEERVLRGHFKFPSAGSVFRNNRVFGKPSGKIIDDAGLCGMRIGGAQIAPWHGNLIINTGGATQKDVKELVDFIVNRVKEKRNFILQPEIIFCGKP